MMAYREVGVRRAPWVGFMVYVGATIAALYIVAPFSWLVLTSVMREGEALSVPPHWIPREPTLANYRSFIWPEAERAAAGGQVVEHVVEYFRNSIVVAGSVSVLNLVFGSMAAYALARIQFHGSTYLILFYLVSRMVPSVAILIPLFLVMQTLGLLDHVLSLIIAYTSFTLPFTIWILRSYFQTIPRDLEDAARVDRCGWFRMMIHVLLPVATPALVAALIFSFMASWSEFLYAVVFTSTEASRTITVAVSQFATDFYVEKTLMTAAGVIAVVPPLLVALVFQRLLVQGLISGSIKG